MQRAPVPGIREDADLVALLEEYARSEPDPGRRLSALHQLTDCLLVESSVMLPAIRELADDPRGLLAYLLAKGDVHRVIHRAVDCGWLDRAPNAKARMRQQAVLRQPKPPGRREPETAEAMTAAWHAWQKENPAPVRPAPLQPLDVEF